MKQILLIMTILQVKSLWNSFKGVFSLKKLDTTETKQTLSQLESKFGDKNVVNGIMVIFLVLYGLFLAVYHTLAAIYVNNITFVALSCVFVVSNAKGIFKVMKWLVDKDDKVINKKFSDRVFSLVYLTYIIYLVRFLTITW